MSVWFWKKNIRIVAVDNQTVIKVDNSNKTEDMVVQLPRPRWESGFQSVWCSGKKYKNVCA